MAVAEPDTSAGLKCLGVPTPEAITSFPPRLGWAKAILPNPAMNESANTKRKYFLIEPRMTTSFWLVH